MSFLPTAKMPPTLQSNISCCRKLHWLWISFFVSTGDLIVTLNKVRLNKQLQLVWRERINTSTWDWHLPQSNPDNFLTSLSVGLKETREQFPGTVIVSLPVIRVNLKSNLKQGAKVSLCPLGRMNQLLASAVQTLPSKHWCFIFKCKNAMLYWLWIHVYSTSV